MNEFWLQLVISFSFLIVLFLIARLLSKKANVFSHKTTDLKIIDQVRLGQREKVVIIMVDNKKLLLGVTPNSINLIKHMDDAVKNDESEKI